MKEALTTLFAVRNVPVCNGDLTLLPSCADIKNACCSTSAFSYVRLRGVLYQALSFLHLQFVLQRYAVRTGLTVNR
jgi:hypothetical protein